MHHMGNEGTKSIAATILLVEREVLVRLELSEYLRSGGFKVIEAGTADEALVVLTNELASHVNIVLSGLDIRGNLDGFGLARWVRQNRPEIKVILAGSVR